MLEKISRYKNHLVAIYTMVCAVLGFFIAGWVILGTYKLLLSIIPYANEASSIATADLVGFETTAGVLPLMIMVAGFTFGGVVAWKSYLVFEGALESIRIVDAMGNPIKGNWSFRRTNGKSN